MLKAITIASFSFDRNNSVNVIIIITKLAELLELAELQHSVITFGCVHFKQP